MQPTHPSSTILRDAQDYGTIIYLIIKQSYELRFIITHILVTNSKRNNHRRLRREYRVTIVIVVHSLRDPYTNNAMKNPVESATRVVRVHYAVTMRNGIPPRND